MFISKVSSVSLGLAISLVPVSALASSFNKVIAFGDSLTDSGNVALYTAPNYQSVPFGGIIPSLAYQSGRFTNGPTWVETLATRLGVSASPYLAGGTNFAFGGARTGPLGTTPPTSPSLLDQFALFQVNTGGIAPSDALYVVWGGSKNARDAAVQKQAGNNSGATAILNQAVGDIVTIIAGLKTAGAVNISCFTNLSRLG
ncbi:MAG: SGNH/GDSL hydrolase family protein [Snowella sp.]